MERTNTNTIERSTLESDVRFASWKLELLNRAHDAPEITFNLLHRVARDAAILGYLDRLKGRELAGVL